MGKMRQNGRVTETLKLFHSGQSELDDTFSGRGSVMESPTETANRRLAPMFLRTRRTRIAVLCLTAAASFGTNSAFAADTDSTIVPATLFPSSQSSAIKQTAGKLEHLENQNLPQLVNNAISISSRRYLVAGVHTPWQIMHGLLALRGEYKIKVDGKKVSALNWLTERRSYKGLPIIEHTQYGGRFHTFTEPKDFEGHPNQFLAIATMSELPVDFSFGTTAGGQVTIQDMINNAKADVNDREEITWTLWALARYLPVDSEWYSNTGEAWSIERLIQIQTYANPDEAACGGTHGLFALSLARNSYLATGKPLRGIWLEADQKIKRFIAKARSLQNEDGTFSTEYFKGPGQSSDFGKRIATSGHILEFLMVAAHDDQLKQEWLQKAIAVVADDLVVNRSAAADCGPLFHAVHALVLYRQRAGIKPAEANLAHRTLKKKTTEKSTNAAVESGDKKPISTEDKTVGAKPSLPADAKPVITAADPAKPARIEPGNAKKITPPESAEPLAKREPDSKVRPLSNTESRTPEEESKTDEPSEFDSEVAKPIVPTETTPDDDASESESSESEESPKVTYRLPEDNAYQSSDAGPGGQDVSEIPLPPTDD